MRRWPFKSLRGSSSIAEQTILKVALSIVTAQANENRGSFERYCSFRCPIAHCTARVEDCLHMKNERNSLKGGGGNVGVWLRAPARILRIIPGKSLSCCLYMCCEGERSGLLKDPQLR